MAPGWRALMAGTVSMTYGLSAAMVSFGGGYVIAGQGYRAFFLIVAGLTLAGTLSFWAYFRVPRGELARRPADEHPSHADPESAAASQEFPEG